MSPQEQPSARGTKALARWWRISTSEVVWIAFNVRISLLKLTLMFIVCVTRITFQVGWKWKKLPICLISLLFQFCLKFVCYTSCSWNSYVRVGVTPALQAFSVSSSHIFRGLTFLTIQYGLQESTREALFQNYFWQESLCWCLLLVMRICYVMAVTIIGSIGHTSLNFHAKFELRIMLMARVIHFHSASLSIISYQIILQLPLFPR